MEIEINRELLNEKIQKVSKVISTKASTYQILDNILFRFNKSTLDIIASDNFTTLTESFDFVTDEKLEIAISSKMMSEFLKNVNDEVIRFIINRENYNVELFTKNGSFKVVGLEGKLFPTVAKFEKSNSFDINVNFLNKAIKSTIFSSANDENHPKLSSLYFDFTEDGISFVATDRLRLALFSNKEFSPKKKDSFLISKKPLTILTDFFDDKDEDVLVEYSDNQVSFSNDKKRFTSKLTEGPFPNYRAVIATDLNNVVLIDRVALLAATKRVSIFTDREAYKLIFEFSKDNLKIEGSDTHIASEASENISCNYSFDEITFGLNGRFIREVLEIIDTEFIQIKFSSKDRPIILNPIKDNKIVEEVFYLLMPLKVDRKVEE